MLKRNRMAAALEALPQLSLIIIELPLAARRSRKGSGRALGPLNGGCPSVSPEASDNHILAVGPLHNHPCNHDIGFGPDKAPRGDIATVASLPRSAIFSTPA